MLQAPDGEDAEEPEALDMTWPDTNRKRITYVLIAPIVFPLWLTLPDTRTPRGESSLQNGVLACGEMQLPQSEKRVYLTIQTFCFLMRFLSCLSQAKGSFPSPSSAASAGSPPTRT